VALQSHLDADRTVLPNLRLTIAWGASGKKNASRQNVILQQTHRHSATAQRAHCYFCIALDTSVAPHHHSFIE